MIKIAIIGAGSIVFSGRLISDLVQARHELRGAHVVLMDINRQRLEAVYALATRFAKEWGAHFVFQPTTSRQEALQGADFVINTAFVPGYQKLEAERNIAEKLGYYRGIGDRVSDYYGGIGAYAQLKFSLELAREMENVCPKAWLLQSANPVLEATTLIARETSVRVVGMCHGYAKILDVLKALELPEEEVEYQVAGLNHCIWLTRFRYKGENAYPLLDHWLEAKATAFWSDEKYWFQPQQYQMSPAAFALYKMFGLFPIGDTVRAATPWWFHENLEAQKRWFPAGGMDSEIGWTCRLSQNIRQLQRFEQAIRTSLLNFREIFSDEPSREPHIPFVIAVVNNKPARLVLNVPNQDVIHGIPSDVVVEVHCLVQGEEIRPEPVEPFPKRLMLYVIIPRWLRMERMLHAFQAGDRMSLVLEIAEDHRTRSWEQAIKVVEELLAQPWNDEAKRHYKNPPWGWDFPTHDYRRTMEFEP